VAAGLPVAALAYEGAGILREEEQPAPVKPAPVLTRPPAVLKPVDAVYPAELYEAGIGGDVTLLIEIGADGTVRSAEVKAGSGIDELDANARAALLQFSFSPAELDGVPAAVQLEYVYHFVPAMPVEPAADATAPGASSPDSGEGGAAARAEPKPAPVNLTGQVLQRGSRDPLVGATVYLRVYDLVTETDAEGRFELRGVPAGAVQVEVTAEKHRPFESSVEVREGEQTLLTAYLWLQVEEGQEATVRGQRDKKEVARRTLEKDELRSVPGTFGDPVRVIQNLPGMARAPFVSGALLVRGAQPQDTSVLIDGVPIPLLYHFAGGPSVVNPSFIDRIDFFPGAYGARYGRAIAGVVDIGTKPPEPKALHGNFEIDLLKSGFYVEGPIKQGENWGTWALAARRSYFDTYLPSILEAFRRPGDAVVVAAPVYWDYQSRYDLDLGRDKLEFVVFGSDDTLAVAQAGTTSAQGFSLNQRQGFHRARIKWSRKLAEGWILSVAPTMGTTIVDLDFADTIALGIGSWDFNTRAVLRGEFNPRLKLESGLEFNTNLFNLDFQLPRLPQYATFPGEAPDLGTERRQFGLTSASQAIYADAVWSPWEPLKLVPGVRMELYQLKGGPTLSVEPRMAARYDLSTESTIKAAWGLYRQGPNPQRLDADLGNPYLGLSGSNQVNVGYEQRLPARLSLDLQGFYNWRYDLEEASDAVVERDGQQVRENWANTGLGRAYGVELLLKQDVTQRAYGWVAYTLMRSEQYNRARETWLPVSTDQTHILTTVASYKWDGGWETGLRFRLTTGRPTTELTGANYDADTGGYRCLRTDPGSVRGATFHQLDLRVEKLFTFETWRLSAYLDVQNVYNAENPELTLTDYRCRQTAPLRGLPLVPTLGVTGSY